MNILKNKNCNIKINDDNSNIVYVKTENGIFKCYKSETMHKSIYYPVNGSGYIDYNDVEKILTINDLFEENQELKKQQKEFIKWLENESKEVIRDAGYHQRICLEILSKYKEIMGGDNNG